MPKVKTILIKEYLQKVKSAKKELTKKEAFKIYLTVYMQAMLKQKTSLIKLLLVLKDQLLIFHGKIEKEKPMILQPYKNI